MPQQSRNQREAQFMNRIAEDISGRLSQGDDNNAAQEGFSDGNKVRLPESANETFYDGSERLNKKEIHTEQYSIVERIISDQNTIAKTLESATRILMEDSDGTVDIDVFEEVYIALTEEFTFSKSEIKKLSSEGDQLRQYLTRAVEDTPRGSVQSIESRPEHTIRTLLMMAWEIREKAEQPGGLQVEINNDLYADRWGLSYREGYMLGELVKLDKNEFDQIESSLVKASTGLQRLERVRAVIESGDSYDILTEPELEQRRVAAEDEMIVLEIERAEKEREQQRELTAAVEKGRAMRQVISDAYPDEDVVTKSGVLEKIHTSDVEAVLREANARREEIQTIASRFTGADLESMPDLVNTYTLDNLEDSVWITPWLLQMSTHRNVENSSSDSFNEAYRMRVDKEIGVRAWRQKDATSRRLIELQKDETVEGDPLGIVDEINSALEVLTKNLISDEKTGGSLEQLSNALRNIYEAKYAGEPTPENSSRIESALRRVRRTGKYVVATAKSRIK